MIELLRSFNNRAISQNVFVWLYIGTHKNVSRAWKSRSNTLSIPKTLILVRECSTVHGEGNKETPTALLIPDFS